MSYDEDIKRRIRTTELWPDFDSPEFLDNLDELAEQSLATNTLEGALASVLIYHQLSEEILRVLLRSAQFFIQLAIFPSQITFSEPKRRVFGQLIEDVKSTTSLLYKDEILELAAASNKHRIELVHKLASRQTLNDVVSQAREVKQIYDGLFSKFGDAQDEFRLAFKDFRKDVFVDDP
jgi:transcriptional antiterminator